MPACGEESSTTRHSYHFYGTFVTMCLQRIAFHSRKMKKHEINYEIHDKELLAITSAFKEWRRHLEGARHKINVFRDHRGLEWFAQNKPLNRRQARCAQQACGAPP